MKNLILLFVLFSSFYSSQEYYFDYKCYDNETQLKGRYKGNKRTNIIYFNSQNKDFIAYDYSFSQESKRSFFLYDYKNKGLINSYSINKKSEFSSLKFLQTSQLNINKDEIEMKSIDVEKISENVFIIKTFSSLKRKLPNLELKMVVEKSNFPMPEIRFMDLTPNIHSKIYNALLLKLDSPNYRIVNVTTDYKNRVIMHDDISQCEKINLKFLNDPKFQ